jgi:diaminohydroxyphosphoribosylaminopyrimidine deaminase/5-amino-6-(5-phosphoribosylamino)uracil reductase
MNEGLMVKITFTPPVEDHIKYMHRCLQLAALGIRKTAPNPMVGAVIVYDNRIIGEGYHTRHGAPHAEIEAFNAVKEKSLIPASTLYVSLEPCNHYGKTPPCTEAIIQNGIRKVVISHQDPFAEVNGEGINKLRSAGIEVQIGILDTEARFLNRRFITFHTRKRPYIILKWAMSADGFMGMQGKNIRISNEESRLLTHKWRSEEQAILVGAGTVATDDPELNTRLWPGENPLRVILDTRGELKSDAKIFNGQQQTLVLTSSSKKTYPSATTIELPGLKNRITEAIEELYNRNIQSLLVEGGRITLNQFIENGLWDEIRIFQSDENLQTGILAPELNILPNSIQAVGNNSLITIFNPN